MRKLIVAKIIRQFIGGLDEMGGYSKHDQAASNALTEIGNERFDYPLTDQMISEVAWTLSIMSDEALLDVLDEQACLRYR